MRIPFFRVGRHTSNTGVTQDYTAEEIDRRISLYNEQHDHLAPVVIGHPKMNGPAFGWIKRLWRDGDIAFAEVDQAQPEFVEWLKKGLFKKVSASFYGNGLLRHIGYLGANPPAIKGLPETEFTDEGAETIEFAAENDLHRVTWSFENVRRGFQALRDWMIEKEGVESADKVLSQWLIDGIEFETAPPTDSAFEEGAATKPDGTQPEGADAEGTEASSAQTDDHAEIAAASGGPAGNAAGDRIAQLEADLAAERQRTAQLEADAQARAARSAAESFCDAEDLRSRISPAMRPAVIELVLLAGTQEFGEAGEDGKKQTLRDALAGVLRGLPVYAEFSEQVTSGPTASSGAPDENAAKAAAAAFNNRHA